MNKMDIERISNLLEKFVAGTATPSEESELHAWYRQLNLSKEDNIPILLKESEKEQLKRKMLRDMLKQIGSQSPGKVVPFYKKKEFIRKIAVAAIFFIVAASILFIYNPRKQSHVVIALNILKEDIAPGHNGAILHLSNGKTIALDSTGDGVIAQQGGLKIVKKDGKLSYIGKSDKVVYNDIVTARGQQWELELPDGTKVWLNAASSIHYPLSFKGKERLVKITGEAYFEVVHNSAQPFKVQVGNLQIEDIGTTFNVNAYSDEPLTKTTLVDGSVKVSTGNNTKLLTPGQQAITQENNSIQIKKNVNVEEVISWKNGQIRFENEDLQTIMRQISRWYDVDISYQNNIPNKIFNGGISRKSNLSELLKILEFEGVRFTQKGRNIIVNP